MGAQQTKHLAWERAALDRGLIPQPHGGALMPGGGYRPGAGRPKSRVKAALEEARGDLLRQVRVAGQFVRDKSLPLDELIRAGNFLLDVLRRHDRKARKHGRPHQRTGFKVVSATADEMAAKVAAHAL